MCAKSCTRLTDECAWQSLNALKTGIEAIDNVRRVGAILAKRTDDQNSDRMSQVTMFGYCCQSGHQGSEFSQLGRSI